MLPKIAQGEIAQSKVITGTQTFSRPPARFTEASLVKRLEAEGIGRPSTYAPTISTIIDRGYVEKKDRKYLHPTETAFTVTDFLQQYFSQMIEYSFTKSVEEEFDIIADGKMEYPTMLQKFWE
jgi:DNA topoisomerase-1